MDRFVAPGDEKQQEIEVAWNKRYLCPGPEEYPP
jgi:hypothetical protein